LKKKIIIYTYQ
jgi:solute carrier family 6 (neurotransmitter transporter, glycine) member 5/9